MAYRRHVPDTGRQALDHHIIAVVMAKSQFVAQFVMDLSRCISRAAQCLADTHNINVYITQIMEAGGGSLNPNPSD